MTQNEDDRRKRIEQLEEENDLLRRAAEKFGQLAERLNTELRAERRAGEERRQSTRDASERRPGPKRAVTRIRAKRRRSP